MDSKIHNILFICTHNATRSIMAEAIMNDFGAGRFQAHSAGSRAGGEIHPLTLEVLRIQNHDVTHLRSKSWEEFTRPEAPKMDFIFTVCDHAAGESCPSWPGQPVSAHWGFLDPTTVEDDQARRKAFNQTYVEIANRIRIFLSLPFEKLERRSLQNALRDMG
ncbi:arsenate reductase ArsC [Herbaspirillum sp. ST 5-3]|uniref:arsenate reductase ArsC n=1 Tax=Oxalobacteraceae TaxID=75682 RepID=UPI0010A2E4D9|nr:arsenate reductase ArsC [Herbaspirillum sp. ST 5-3]